eukprot:14476499-Alexandrium_andersonii.AAC.1
MHTQDEAANLTEAAKQVRLLVRGRCATAPSTTRAAAARRWRREGPGQAALFPAVAGGAREPGNAAEAGGPA